MAYMSEIFGTFVHTFIRVTAEAIRKLPDEAFPRVINKAQFVNQCEGYKELIDACVQLKAMIHAASHQPNFNQVYFANVDDRLKLSECVVKARDAVVFTQDEKYAEAQRQAKKDKNKGA